MATKLGEAFVVIGARTHPLTRGLNYAFSLTKRMMARITHTIKRMVQAAIVTFTALEVFIIKTGAGFERSMSRVAALSEATGQELKALRETAKELGKVTIFSAAEAAEGMQFFALAGFEANKIVAAMPATLNLAAAGQLKVAQAANITAKIMAGLGIEADALGPSVDVLAKAFTSANTNLMQLGEALKFAGPLGRATGKSLEELVSVIQVLSNVGIQGTMAGTSLRRILGRLAGATPAVTKKLKQLGIVIADNSGKMLPLDNIIDQLNKKLNTLNSSTAKTAVIMELFGDRAGPAMVSLMEEGGAEIRRYSDLLRGSLGTAMRIAEMQTNNLWGDYIKLISVVKGLAISIFGEESSLGMRLRKYVQSAKKWFEENETDIIKWANIIHDKIFEMIDTFAEWVKGLDDWKQGIREAFDFAVKKTGELFDAITKSKQFREFGLLLGELIAKGIAVGIKGAIKRTSIYEELVTNFNAPRGAKAGEEAGKKLIPLALHPLPSQNEPGSIKETLRLLQDQADSLKDIRHAVVTSGDGPPL